jgi:organic radical activating enzyme
MRDIQSINYIITTYCNRTCPDCCCNIETKQHFNWDYIQASVKYFRNMPRIHLTGGEPTIHPDFKEIVPKLKELFGCTRLTIESNGVNFRKFPEIFTYFDEVYASIYTERTHKGCLSNEKDVKFLQKYLEKTSTKFFSGDIIHFSKNTKPSGRICERGLSETVSYYNNKVYPCCVAPGVKDSKGILVTPNWKKDILEVPLPCSNCLFSF